MFDSSLLDETDLKALFIESVTACNSAGERIIDVSCHKRNGEFHVQYGVFESFDEAGPTLTRPTFSCEEICRCLKKVANFTEKQATVYVLRNAYELGFPEIGQACGTGREAPCKLNGRAKQKLTDEVREALRAVLNENLERTI